MSSSGVPSTGIFAWNPLSNTDSFVSIWGSRLKTYTINPATNNIQQEKYISLPLNATCCSWSPSFVHKLCVGTEAGSLYLINTKEGVVEKEFTNVKVDKGRTRCVRWNPNNHLIAHGVEKPKGMPGLMIWDIHDTSVDRSHALRSTFSENSNNSSFRASTSGLSQDGSNMGEKSQGTTSTTNIIPTLGTSNHIHQQSNVSSVQSSVALPTQGYTHGQVFSSLPSHSYLDLVNGSVTTNLVNGVSTITPNDMSPSPQIPIVNIHSSLSQQNAGPFETFSNSVYSNNIYNNSIHIEGSVADTVRKPVSEFLMNDSVFSIAWIPNAPMNLLAGTYKSIRLIDIRENPKVKASKTSLSAHSKNVNHIEFNPFDYNYFASVGADESVIKVWDVRNLTVPVLKKDVCLSPVHKVVHMEWSSTEKNVIASLTTEGDAIRIWNVPMDKKTPEPSLPYKYSPYRSVHLPTNDLPNDSQGTEIMTTFALNFTSPHRVLMGTASRISIKKIEAQAPLFSVAPFGDRIISFDGKKFETRELSNYAGGDICEVMRTRAKKMIGMDFKHNLDISREINDRETLPLWEWGTRLKKLNNLDGRKSEIEYEYVGILSILNRDRSKSKQPLPFLTTAKENVTLLKYVEKSPFKLYSNDKRRVAITLCWWEDEEDTLSSLKQLSERDAAIAIFRYDLNLAGEILTKLNNDVNNYGMLAFGLLGFSEERRSLFRSAATSLLNPYLQAAFKFLSGDGSDIHSILADKEIRIADKVAIACMYLSDDDLFDYVKNLASTATREGDLEGILLTGFNNAGLVLVQNFVNNTNDVQTACLAFSHVVPLQYTSDQVDRWLQAYRELLDIWQFWELRATLDTSLSAFTKSMIQKKNPGVVIRCIFCMYPLREGVEIKGSKNPPKGLFSASKPATTCFNCNKLLPKCSICLTPYGTSMPSLGEVTENCSDPMVKLNYCFAWCRNCKHGGHVKHLMEWFLIHEECPVSGCSCCCNIGSPSFQGRER